MPFLKKIKLDPSKISADEYPFNIPSFAAGIDLELRHNVSFLVGENGSGKSTLLEAIAEKCEFNLSGGNRNHRYEFQATESNLASALKLTWFPSRVSEGFFMRAESFFNFATYVDALAEAEDERVYDSFGGKSLHQQSHGESFLSLFRNKFRKGIYLLDEPEAALSPARQLSFLSIIHALAQAGKAQFIIATHSPILLSYPFGCVYSLDQQFEIVDYRETAHFRLTQQFLNDPDRYFKTLFDESHEESEN
jgi:predicted ATPase